MTPYGRLTVERGPQHLLFWGIRQMLFGSNDIGDAHRHVIDDVRQVEHRGSIAAHENEIFDDRMIEFDITSHCVTNDRASLRHPKSQHPPGTRLKTEVTRPSVIPGDTFGSRSFFDVCWRHLAVIGVTRLIQLRRRSKVLVGIVALKIRSFERGACRVNTKPLESRQDAIGPFRSVTSLIGVFDPEHECSTG